MGAHRPKRSEDKTRSRGDCVALHVMGIWARGGGAGGEGKLSTHLAQEACLSTQVPSSPLLACVDPASEACVWSACC